MKRISVSVTLLIMALCINALAQNKGAIKGAIQERYYRIHVEGQNSRQVLFYLNA